MSDVEQPGADAAVDSTAVTRRDRAIALIDAGNTLEEQGRAPEAMARYEAAVEADPRCARAHLNRGNLLLAGAHIEAARSAYQLAIDCDPRYAAAHFNLGNLNSRAGEHQRALHDYRAALDIRPDFAAAFVAMGNALDSLGRSGEARESYQRALAIDPAEAGAHFNLGVLAMSAGQPRQAADSFRKATESQPGFAAAHHALGQVLRDLGDLAEAEASLRRAWSIEPESEDFLCDLAMALVARSKSPEAVQLIMAALERSPTRRLKTAFAHCVARTRFATYDARIRAPLTAAIVEAWAIPYQLCGPALSLLMLDPRIAPCLRIVNEARPARAPRAALCGAGALGVLAADPLLCALLEAAPVSSLEFERLLTALRHALLETAANAPSSDPADAATVRFYAALARQCFVNEYIFDCDDGERASAAACRANLLTLLEAGAPVPPLLLLAVACYFPLYTLPDPRRLLAGRCAEMLDGVLLQQVGEPLEERALRDGIERLTVISPGVSERVREQYEHNPYPRWLRLPMEEAGLGFNEELRRTFPLARFTPLSDDSQPEVLIAGCGTGSQPLITRQRFRGLRILAVDLSLSSISYAMRKSRESGISNIAYAQADILRLGDIERTFDIIGAVGVLHHLADPFEGWRILLSRLRPGGFMHLGFYSRLARRHVVKARERIAAGGYAATPDDIRRFRRDLTASAAAPELKWLSELSDFYSMSECRDLLFHVQEHRLSLDEIEAFLGACGLDFLGFDLDARALREYRTRFADDPAATNLKNWARFESDHPDTFIGMYQFWIQKPLSW